MKIGIQTIVFGRYLDEVEKKMELLQGIGFQGVEFFQHHENITSNGKALSFKELNSLLSNHNLKLLGLSGGDLTERLNYYRRDGEEPKQELPYVYVDDPDDVSQYLATEILQTLSIALHPHAFKRYEHVNDMESCSLSNTPGVFLLPDTAHMTIVGDDPVSYLETTNLDRIILFILRIGNPRTREHTIHTHEALQI